VVRHKEKIVRYAKANEEEVFEILHKVLKVIQFYNESFISTDNYRIAYELCKDIDKKDIPFVALTIELQGALWTGDKKLKDGLKTKGFDRFFEIDLKNS
jgi:predicted nucleic acid-binding protein